MAQQNNELKADICVIGANAGGLAVAAAAAASGASAVLIENGGMGGDILRKDGSVPVQALIAAAAHANAMRNGARFGAKAVRVGIDFGAVSAHVRHVIDVVAPNLTRERFAGLGVRFLSGTARFTDPETVVAGDLSIKAGHFVVAAGSVPIIPEIPGLLDIAHLTSETVADLAELPRHLIVIGAGRTGLELAQAFRRLGAEVTVLESATPLAHADPECAAIVLDALEREGVALRTEVAITNVRRAFARVQVTFAASAGAETIEGSHLLVAAGRRVNLDDLGLGAAGIGYTPQGITADQHLRTTNKRVYAVGDIAGMQPSAHAATYHAGIVVRHALLRMPVKVNHLAVPSVIRTDPELAQIGLLEEEARARKHAIRVLRWPYRENDRAQAAGATDGHIKVVTDRSGTILGATIVGADAGEIIAPWALAIRENLNIQALGGFVVPYPSYAEVGKRAAATYLSRGLTSARVRRIIGWLRRRP
jgi:pyruvate/2-oxoglutarate dehydrogenase complex dihydrolipoamide dehydrogenase (E3) component